MNNWVSVCSALIEGMHVIERVESRLPPEASALGNHTQTIFFSLSNQSRSKIKENRNVCSQLCIFTGGYGQGA